MMLKDLWLVLIGRLSSAERDNYRAQFREQLHKNDLLIKRIRDMDQLIYAMSQCTSWDQMRPIFRNLQAGTEDRMTIESNRIRDLLIPEIRKAHTDGH